MFEQLKTRIRGQLFNLHPRLGRGIPYIISAVNYSNYTRPANERFEYDHFISDFKEDVMVFLRSSNGYQISDWHSITGEDVKYGSVLLRTRTIWFFDASDAIQFKLTFGANDVTRY